MKTKHEVKFEASKRGLTLRDVANGINMSYNVLLQRLGGFLKSDGLYTKIESWFKKYDGANS